MNHTIIILQYAYTLVFVNLLIIANKGGKTPKNIVLHIIGMCYHRLYKQSWPEYAHIHNTLQNAKNYVRNQDSYTFLRTSTRTCLENTVDKQTRGCQEVQSVIITPCAQRGKGIGLSIVVVVAVIKKIARSRHLCFLASDQCYESLTTSLASEHMIRATNVTSHTFVWPHLLTTPIQVCLYSLKFACSSLLQVMIVMS